MGRGFLSGVLWGAVVSALGLGAASKLLPVIEVVPPAPEAAAVEVPGDSEFSRDGAEADPVLPDMDSAPEVETAPEAEAATPDAPPSADTNSAEQPQTGAPEADAMIAPQDEVAAAEAPSAEEPAPATDAAPAPETPASDPSPEAAEPVAVPDIDPEAEALADPQTEAGPEIEADPVQTAAAAPDVAQPESGAPESPVAGAAEAPTVPDVALDADAPQPPEVADDSGVSLFEGVGEIAVPTPDTSDSTGGLTLDAPEGPALEVNAVAFDWDGRAPILSVVLIADSEAMPDPETIRNFPIPLTIAVDPQAANAGEIAAALRDAGAEVAMIAPLAEGAAPADVEVAFETYLNAVPMAATVIDTEAARFQENRPRASQVVAVLQETGHGMVTYDAGLNTALQVASQEGVPAAVVLRAFDDGERNVSAMKRFLDQAAFQAGLDGSAIVTGQFRPEALTAIAEWALGSRAAALALAPVSGVLNSAP